MNIGNFCDTFKIDSEVDKELYDYIDKFQRKSLQKALGSCQDKMEILAFLRNSIQVLFESCVDGKIYFSYGNAFQLYEDGNKVKIFWKIQNPFSQMMKFEYEI